MIFYKINIIKRGIFLFLLLNNLFLYSQNNIEIDYLYSKKKSKIDTIRENEVYKLFINENSSYYLSEQKFRSDSISKIILKNNDLNKAMNNISLYKVNELIYTNKKENNILTYKYIPGKRIVYEENFIKDWKITNKTKRNSSGILLNNAEIDYGGRKWFVWYSSEYPINEGPYKFKNLPGLVFEVYDSENIFRFELIKIKKTKYNYTKDFPRFTLLPKPKFLEVLKNYVNNPLPELTQMLTPESKHDIVKKYIDIYRNNYYIEKDFEIE